MFLKDATPILLNAVRRAPIVIPWADLTALLPPPGASAPSGQSAGTPANSAIPEAEAPGPSGPSTTRKNKGKGKARDTGTSGDAQASSSPAFPKRRRRMTQGSPHGQKDDSAPPSPKRAKVSVPPPGETNRKKVKDEPADDEPLVQEVSS